MSKPSPKNVDFAKELQELEAIVEWFEGGDVDLNQALTKFQRGMELAERLKHYLSQVENRVEVIKRKFDQPAKPTDSEPAPVADNPELFG